MGKRPTTPDRRRRALKLSFSRCQPKGMRSATRLRRGRDYRNLTRRNRRGDPRRSGTNSEGYTRTRQGRTSPGYLMMITTAGQSPGTGRHLNPWRSSISVRELPVLHCAGEAHRRVRRFCCGLSRAETPARGDRSCRASAASFSLARWRSDQPTSRHPGSLLAPLTPTARLRRSANTLEAGEIFHQIGSGRNAFGGFGHPGGDLAGPGDVLRGEDRCAGPRPAISR